MWLLNVIIESDLRSDLSVVILFTRLSVEVDNYKA